MHENEKSKCFFLIEGSIYPSNIIPLLPLIRGRLRNQSELEVNAQHYKMQNVYKSQRARKGKKLLTDIDFEGGDERIF